MNSLCLLAAAGMLSNTAAAQRKSAFSPIVPRFERESPLPTIPGVMIDSYTTGGGLAEETARGRNLQARILWIDATANIDKYNTEDKIVALVKQIRDAGFNTIVFDVKPISGQVVYPSKLAPKLLAWRGQLLPQDFDPLAIMVREAKKNDLTLFASLNAFSEGHRLFNVGPGYEKTEQQTVLYEPKPIVKSNLDGVFPIAPTPNLTDPTAVDVYESAEKLPPTFPAGFEVALNSSGRVIESGEQGPNDKPLIFPKGGVVLFGSDVTGGATGVPSAATWLRQNSLPGTAVSFDTQPEYVPMGQSKQSQIPLMMNPNDPAEREYELAVVKELVSNYALDGILYDDRFRYAGLDADFSPLTRDLFEAYVGKKLNWPDDVFKYTLTESLRQGIQPGMYYDAWMAWRASRLKDYLDQVRQDMHAIRPGLQIGLYVGSWYGDYPALGDNYASANTQAGFWFMTPAYQRTGLASSLDFLIAGCYYPTATIYDAMTKGQGIGSTIEASGSLVNQLVGDQTWTYAGISLDDYAGNPDALQDALQAACASTQGVMVFDLSHDIEPMWPVFTRSFSQPRRAPHSVPRVLADVRRRRANLEKFGYHPSPVIISAGTAGTGQ